MNKTEALKLIHDNVTFTRDGMVVDRTADRRSIIEAFFTFGIIVLPSQLYNCYNKNKEHGI